jgi:Cu2+-exporting ATPase
VYDVLRGLPEDAGRHYLEAARRLGIIPGADPRAPPDAVYPADPAAEREERFRIEGLVCPSCVWVAERVLLARAGVLDARFDFLTGSGVVRYDLRRASSDALARWLKPLGYCLSRLEHPAQGSLSRRLTFEFVATGVITMNLMSLSAVRYAGDLGWIQSVPSFLPWLELALCVPVMVLGWLPGARRALAGIGQRRLNMDCLIALSAGAAFALSCAALVTGHGDIYFETAAGLVTVALLSRMVEARLRQSALRETAALMRLDVVRVRVPGPAGEDTYRSVDDVGPGDAVLLRTGEVVPFDGEVVNGHAHVSEAVITGEPTPLRKTTGELVTAGSQVVEGLLHLRVHRRYDETRLRRIAESLRESLAHAEGRLRSADAIAAWFVPAVVIIAVGVWAGRLVLHGPSYALSAPGWFPSVAVLAVACPCAFSLAGAAASTAAVFTLLRRGFLVQNPTELEALARVSTFVFDKTGTLTEGRLEVEALCWHGAPQTELLPRVAGAEQDVTHPVGRAIREYLRDQSVQAAPLHAEDVAGLGRRTSDLAVGAAGLFQQVFGPPDATNRHTLVWFGPPSGAAGCFLIADTVRTGARDAVAGLQALGLRVELLSGDRQEVCDWVGAAVGADSVSGGVELRDKVTLIADRSRAGERIAYVGDGTNDALAMREAAAAVAVAGSTDEALTASGIVMRHGRLVELVALVRTARKLARVVRGNFAWAFVFNASFIPVAALGWLRPLFAMLLMLMSSSAVLLNSLRMKERR